MRPGTRWRASTSRMEPECWEGGWGERGRSHPSTSAPPATPPLSLGTPPLCAHQAAMPFPLSFSPSLTFQPFNRAPRRQQRAHARARQQPPQSSDIGRVLGRATPARRRQGGPQGGAEEGGPQRLERGQRGGKQGGVVGGDRPAAAEEVHGGHGDDGVCECVCVCVCVCGRLEAEGRWPRRFRSMGQCDDSRARLPVWFQRLRPTWHTRARPVSRGRVTAWWAWRARWGNTRERGSTRARVTGTLLSSFSLFPRLGVHQAPPFFTQRAVGVWARSWGSTKEAGIKDGNKGGWRAQGGGCVVLFTSREEKEGGIRGLRPGATLSWGNARLFFG